MSHDKYSLQKFFGSVVLGTDEISTQLYISKDMAAEQIAELTHREPLDKNMIPVFRSTEQIFLSPNELFLSGHPSRSHYSLCLSTLL